MKKTKQNKCFWYTFCAELGGSSVVLTFLTNCKISCEQNTYWDLAFTQDLFPEVIRS